MSTSYIVNRHSPKITRKALIEEFGDVLYLSDSDLEDNPNLTVETATSIGVNTGCGYIWCSLANDVLVATEDYGRGNSDGHDVIAARLGIELICEDADNFDYHLFPKDVDVDAPDYKSPKDDWEVYLDGGWWHAFNRKERLFIVADACKPEVYNGDIEKYLDEIRALYN